MKSSACTSTGTMVLGRLSARSCAGCHGAARHHFALRRRRVNLDHTLQDSHELFKTTFWPLVPFFPLKIHRAVSSEDQLRSSRSTWQHLLRDFLALDRTRVAIRPRECDLSCYIPTMLKEDLRSWQWGRERRYDGYHSLFKAAYAPCKSRHSALVLRKVFGPWEVPCSDAGGVALRRLFSMGVTFTQGRLQAVFAKAGSRLVPAHACFCFLDRPACRCHLLVPRWPSIAGLGECARRLRCQNARMHAVAQKQLSLLWVGLRLGCERAHDPASREAQAQRDQVSFGVHLGMRPSSEMGFGQRAGLRRGVQPNLSVTMG